MKSFLSILTILIWYSCFSQSELFGLYERQDSKIWLNANYTFKFLYSVDMYRAWAKGTWSINGNKIYLKAIPVYDTITLTGINGNLNDSLIYSKDEMPARINDDGKRAWSLLQYEQNLVLCPTLLFQKRNKLFVLENGKRQTRKIRNGYYVEPFDPWYTKVGVSE